MLRSVSRRHAQSNHRAPSHCAAQPLCTASSIFATPYWLPQPTRGLEPASHPHRTSTSQACPATAVGHFIQAETIALAGLINSLHPALLTHAPPCRVPAFRTTARPRRPGPPLVRSLTHTASSGSISQDGAQIMEMIMMNEDDTTTFAQPQTI
jgi:hypothetical protein